MPLIKTRGAASSQGFGQFKSSYCGGDGTKGIFALGNTNAGLVATRNKYTYACCSSTASGVGSASANSRLGSAAGNSTRGIFHLGDGGPCVAATNNKYTYATCTSTACGVPTGCNSFAGSAAGNSTRGIFALGNDNFTGVGVATTFKYTYATCAKTAGTSLGATTYAGSAAGNATRGIYNRGINKYLCCCVGYVFTNVNQRRKYTYACDSTTAGTAATGANGLGSAAGNTTRGIFALGCQNFEGNGRIATRNKYTYACDTNTGTGVASAYQASNYQSATGNSTRGIFALGCVAGSNSQRRCKYTYACDTNTACVGGASSGASRGSAVSWAVGVNSAA